MIDIISSSVVGVNVSSVTADGFKRELIGGHVISLVDVKVQREYRVSFEFWL